MAPNLVLGCSTATFCNQQLIKHLFLLYRTCVHPVYLLFNVDLFIEAYDTGNEEYCSKFLVAAVCAAACDFLGPLWTSISGNVPDIASLRREFVVEAIFQEVLTNHDSKTWVDASRLMLIVNSGPVKSV